MDSSPQTEPHARSLSTWPLNTLRLLAMTCAALVLGGCAQLDAQLDTQLDSMFARSAAGTEIELPSHSAPVLGRCWAGTATEVTSWRTWRGGDFVSCAEPHTTYTFAAEDLPSELVTAMASTRSDAADIAVRVEVDAAINEICAPAFTDLFPRKTAQQVLLHWFSFLPSPDEWAAGARWVRCDVGVFDFGQSRTSSELVELPRNIHDLTDAVSGTPAQFDFCLNAPASTAGNGPLDTAEAVVANCVDNPLWHLEAVATLPFANGAPYPGLEAVIVSARAACKTDSLLHEGVALTGWVYFPSETSWATGDRAVDCWSTRQ